MWRSSTFFALLFKFHHLLGQIFIALGHLAIGVMGKNAFALGADFLCPDGMGNLGAEHLDFASVGLPQQGGDLLGKVGAVAYHRQKDAVDQQHFLSGLWHPDPQVRAGGCLADAAFLVGDGDDLRVQ